MNNDYKNLRKYFPYPEFREVQEKVLPMMQDFLENENQKVLFLELGTGVGKSGLGIAAARASKDCYLLTASKGLQSQYMTDFGSMLAELKGRSNYPCEKHTRPDTNQPYNCANAPCQTSKSQAKKDGCSGCSYGRALKQAAESSSTLFNFASGYLQLKHNPAWYDSQLEKHGYFEDRNLIIIDEAHLITDYLTGIASMQITDSTFHDLFRWEQVQAPPSDWIEHIEPQESFADWILFIQKIRDQAVYCLDEYMFSEESLPKLQNLKNKTETFLELYQKFKNKFQDQNTKEESFFSIIYETPNDNDKLSSDCVTIRPADVSHLFQFLMQKSKKVILMSATFLNISTYCKMLDLEPENVQHIYADSPFPKKNQPIYVSKNVGKLSTYKNTENHQKLYDAIGKISQNSRFQNTKGIIHAPSYDWCQKIYNGVPTDVRKRILFPRDSDQKKEFLEQHTQTPEPTILLSPSMREGVDLKDDLARFLIISKIPWPDFGDDILQKRRMIYPAYVELQTLLAIVQSLGRGVRHQADYCHRFILDGHFGRLYKENKHMLSEKFQNTIIW